MKKMAILVPSPKSWCTLQENYTEQNIFAFLDNFTAKLADCSEGETRKSNYRTPPE